MTRAEAFKKVMSNKRSGSTFERKDVILKTYAVMAGLKATEAKKLEKANKKLFEQARSEINKWGSVSGFIFRRKNEGVYDMLGRGRYEVA